MASKSDKMCKDTDDPVDTNNAPKAKIPKGLPEPGKPPVLPKEALVPPAQEDQLNFTKPTIANQEKFSDKDLSSLTD